MYTLKGREDKNKSRTAMVKERYNAFRVRIGTEVKMEWKRRDGRILHLFTLSCTSHLFDSTLHVSSNHELITKTLP